MIQISYESCLKSLVGSHGLSPAEISSSAKMVQAAHAAIGAQRSKGKLGFLEISENVAQAKKMAAAAASWRGRYENFVVVGIGGSALGNIALQSALRHSQWNLLTSAQRKGWLKLFVPDNVDPALIGGLLDSIDLKKTIFNVVSKSGTTAECLANYFILRGALEKKVGKEQAKKQIVFTTDPEKGYLREVSRREGILCFDVPPNVGGRFSVLSPVGLLSAAATGIDILELMKGAEQMKKLCDTDKVQKNPAALYALLHYLYYKKGRKIHVMIPYSQELRDIADWFRQLWAESLGKRLDRTGREIFVGPTPVKALGATDQHSQVQLYIEGPHDKLITVLSVKKFSKDIVIPTFDKHYLGGKKLGSLLKAEERATVAALTKERRPNLTITIPEVSPRTVGGLLMLFQLSTAYAGEFFNVNAYDQPGVELGKVLTYALMGRKGFEEQLKEYRKFLPA